MPVRRQLGLFPVIGLWAVLCFAGALYASWQGYGGREFAATLTVFAIYLGVMLFFAARGASEKLSSLLGAGSGYLFGVGAFLGYLIYAAGTNSFAFARVAAVAGLVFVPIALAASAGRAAMGTWQDYLTLVGVWLMVKPLPNPWGFSLSHWLWPYPGGRLAYVFTVLLALNVALAAFVLVRGFSGIGYSIGWDQRWGVYVFGSFLVLACIVIPLGVAIHFIQFAPHWEEWKLLPFLATGILFFTAWPEEFLFRGLLQNMLAKSTKSDLAGWWTASVLFGFSHITNLGFPNWRYVLLASIAGIFYGWTWRKSGSIFASAIVHAVVDVTWHFLFRTL